MRRLIIAAGLVMLTAAAAEGQIISVNPTPPPCTGPHCLSQVRGATVQHHGGPSAQRAACPQGTVYNARKGTCHVMGG